VAVGMGGVAEIQEVEEARVSPVEVVKTEEGKGVAGRGDGRALRVVVYARDVPLWHTETLSHACVQKPLACTETLSFTQTLWHTETRH
jgi:hypothetical protein